MDDGLRAAGRVGSVAAGSAAMSVIDRHLAQVHARISRVDASTALRMQREGALLVDTRPIEQRRAHGVVPGGVAIERNHLEWRLDPTSAHRHPSAVGHHGPIIVFCQEGYSSGLAVDMLDQLGVPDVHELVGGFAAWAAAGLPTTRLRRATGEASR